MQDIQHPQRVLIVDDDEILNGLFCEYLGARGLSTLCALSLAEAKNCLRTAVDIDLILLDYQLGDGCGLDLLTDPEYQHLFGELPVIMISVRDDHEFLESCFALGAADYIIKPVNLPLLALKVSALIRNRALQRLIRQQNTELAGFKLNAEREEAVAKYTYEHLVRQNRASIDGVSIQIHPSTTFSGDIALARFSPRGDLYFLLADATGHGLAAAMTIMPVVAIFNTMVARGFHLETIVAEMNRKLVRDTPVDRFVAALVIQIHRERHEVCVWNGGIPAALWIDQGRVLHEFPSNHMALGILDDPVFDAGVSRCPTPASGEILVFTDGLLEAKSPVGDAFSLARVHEVIAQQPANLLQQLMASLQAHVTHTHYEDDVSLCLLSPSIIAQHFSQRIGLRPLDAELQLPTAAIEWSLRLGGQELQQLDLPPLCMSLFQGLRVPFAVREYLFLVISEVVAFALDQGVLMLDSNRKNTPAGVVDYFTDWQKRLALLGHEDYLQLSMAWQPGHGIHKPVNQFQVTVKWQVSAPSFAIFNTPDRQQLGTDPALLLVKQLVDELYLDEAQSCLRAVMYVNQSIPL